MIFFFVAKIFYAFLWLCNDLGVSIANEKTVQPTQVLIVLGIEFHTVKMIMILPIEQE